MCSYNPYVSFIMQDIAHGHASYYFVARTLALLVCSSLDRPLGI